LPHLDILRALQTFIECNWTRKSKITGAEIQFEKSKGSFKAIIVRRESPSMINGEQPIETANLEANKAAWLRPSRHQLGAASEYWLP
jgi:hypothetical protein